MGDVHHDMTPREALLSYPLSHMDFLALSIPAACFLWLALHLRLGHFPHEVPLQFLSPHGIIYGDSGEIPVFVYLAMALAQIVAYAKMYRGLSKQQDYTSFVVNESVHVKFYRFITRYFIPIHVLLFSFCIPMSTNYSHSLLATFLGLIMAFYTAFRFAYTALFKKYISAQEAG